MPYKLKGNRVMIRRGSRWIVFKTHPNPEAAQKHYNALTINVGHGHKRKKKRKK